MTNQEAIGEGEEQHVSAAEAQAATIGHRVAEMDKLVIEGDETGKTKLLAAWRDGNCVAPMKGESPQAAMARDFITQKAAMILLEQLGVADGYYMPSPENGAVMHEEGDNWTISIRRPHGHQGVLQVRYNDAIDNYTLAYLPKGT